MKTRLRGWALFALAGIILGLASFAFAAWVITDSDPVGNNVFNTGSPDRRNPEHDAHHGDLADGHSGGARRLSSR